MSTQATAAPTDNSWRNIQESFMELSREEQRRADVITDGKTLQYMDRVLRASCNYDEHPEGWERGKPDQGTICLLETPPHGVWNYGDGISENFLERVRLCVAEAGRALPDYPNDADPEDFWLHRLYFDLLKHNSDLLFCATEKGGMTLSVCVASATFCARLERLGVGFAGFRELEELPRDEAFATLEQAYLRLGKARKTITDPFNYKQPAEPLDPETILIEAQALYESKSAEARTKAPAMEPWASWRNAGEATQREYRERAIGRLQDHNAAILAELGESEHEVKTAREIVKVVAPLIGLIEEQRRTLRVHGESDIRSSQKADAATDKRPELGIHPSSQVGHLGQQAAVFNADIRTLAMARKGRRVSESELRIALPDLAIWKAIDDSETLKPSTRAAFFDVALDVHRRDDRFAFIGQIMGGASGATAYDWYKQHRRLQRLS